MSFTAANLFGQILFGAIGLAAFIYGRKRPSFKALILGVAIMSYPFIAPETWMLYTIGAVLTTALFLWKD